MKVEFVTVIAQRVNLCKIRINFFQILKGCVCMSIEKKLKDVLSGLDSKKINESKRSIEELLKTEHGKRIVDSLSGVDKNKVMELFMKMDSEEIKKKLNQADLSKLSGISANDIINKLK